MADPIKPRRTTTAGKVPTTADLADGELGANMVDRRLFMRNGSDIVAMDGTGAFNDQTGTTYTLALTDAANGIRCTNAAAVTVTIPTNASVAFPRYTRIPIRQGGAGAVTVAGDTGVTLLSPNGAATTAEGDSRVLEQTDIDTWVVW